MNIIHETWRFLHATEHCAPLQLKHLYRFGCATLAARPIVSLRANARLAGITWPTAKSKMWRLAKNARMPGIFPALLVHLALVAPDDVIAVDFSDFGNGFQVLMCAKQTGKGRTIPVYFEILRYPVQRGAQNLFVRHAIQRLIRILGFAPHFVFDRGFACPAIVQFLLQNQYPFTLRVKKGKLFADAMTGMRFAAREYQGADLRVRAYDGNLRLVVSDLPADAKERWYLVTNDMTVSCDGALARYEKRFEIEEFFRDAKRLLGMEGVRCHTANGLAVALWFVILGTWALWHLDALLRERHERERTRMQLSRIRYLVESLQTARIRAAEGIYFLFNTS